MKPYLGKDIDFVFKSISEYIVVDVGVEIWYRLHIRLKFRILKLTSHRDF